MSRRQHDPMVWQPRAKVAPERIGPIFATLPIPTIIFETRKNETAFNRLWTNSLHKAIKFTEEGAKEFAQVSAAEIKDHIANFSKPTKGGKASKRGRFGPHEKLDLTGTSLYQSIGWEVRGEFGSGFSGVAGVGVGGKEVPKNPDDEPYAGFVELGTAEGKGRFVPKTVDFTLIDMKDPSNTLTFSNIPESWVPKMSPNINPLLEGWWGAKKKRALLKKRSRNMRYLAESWSNAIWEKKLKGARKSMEKGRPKYALYGTGKAKDWARERGGPKAGYGAVWYRKKLKTIPDSMTTGTDILRDQQGKEFESTWFDEETEAVHEFVDVMGGKLRGYGGKGNILRSVGDISYGYFALDVKFYAMALSGFDPNLLEGLPGVITGKVDNERGLGLRLRTDRNPKPGYWPGTPARNYIRNSAYVMARKLAKWVSESNKGEFEVKGRRGMLRMFRKAEGA